MLRLVRSAALLFLALLFFSSLSPSSAAVSQRLQPLRSSRPDSAQTSAALLSAVSALDCPITTDWVADFSAYVLLEGLLPLSDYTFFAAVSSAPAANPSCSPSTPATARSCGPSTCPTTAASGPIRR